VWLRGSHVSLPTFSIQKCCGPLLPSKHHTALQQQQQQQQLEKASTHRSAKTHTNTVFVPHDFDLSYPKINRFLGLMVEHFCLKFGDPTCSVFIYHAKNRWTHTGRCTNKQITIQTDRQTPLETILPRQPLAWVTTSTVTCTATTAIKFLLILLGYKKAIMLIRMGKSFLQL